MDYIDKEEKELMKSYDRDEWVSVSDGKKAEIEEAADNSTKKNKRINIRLTEKIITIFRSKQWKRVYPIKH